MFFSSYSENAVLAHLFQNQDIINIGDSAGLLQSANPGVLWIALHTAVPGEAGDQTTNEVAYTSYARVAIERKISEWSVVGNVVTNIAAVQFPTATGGSATATHFSVGVDNGATFGVNDVLCYGALPSPLTITSGVQPQLAAGALAIAPFTTLSPENIAMKVWQYVIESGYTAEQLMRVLTAVAAGKTDIVSAGGGSATVTFRDIADAKNRVTAGVTGSERTTITLNATP